MSKRLISGLAIFFLVLAGCQPPAPPPDRYAWCYKFDFTTDDYAFDISNGMWVEGQGITSFSDGLISFTYTHSQPVQPAIAIVRLIRDPATTSTDIDAQANIFSIDINIENNWPGAAGSALDLYFEPEDFNEISPSLDVNIDASTFIAVQSLEVRGDFDNPFGTGPCRDTTPTVGPGVPTETGTPATATNTPVDTNTPTPSLTPSNTPSGTPPTATPICYTGQILIDFDANNSGYTVNLSRGTVGAFGGSQAMIGSYFNGAGLVDQKLLEFMISFPPNATVTRVRYYVNSGASGARYLMNATGTPFRTFAMGAGTVGSVDISGLTYPAYSHGDKMLLAVHHGQNNGSSPTLVIDDVIIDYCTLSATPSSTPTQTLTVTSSATGTAGTGTPSRTPNARTGTPRPTSTPVVLATRTPDPNTCFIVNFDDRTDLGIVFPATDDLLGIKTTVPGRSGSGIRFTTFSGGDGFFYNQRAFFLETSPSWHLRSLWFWYRYVPSGDDSASARYLWSDDGGGMGIQRLPQRYDEGLNYPTGWQRAYVTLNSSGWHGIGSEFNIISTASSYIEIDDIALCADPVQPTQNVTPTYITAEPGTAIPTGTLVPLPTWIPTVEPPPGEVCEGEECSPGDWGECAAGIEVGGFLGLGTFLAQFWNCILLPPILNIQNAVGGFFNWIFNTGRNFFEWLLSIFRWLFGVIRNFFIAIGNIRSNLQYVGSPLQAYLDYVVDVVGLIIQIVRHMLDLIGAWLAQMIDTIQTILYTWYLAAPTPMPFLPNCASNPTGNQACGLYYVVKNTVLAGTVGGLIIPLALIVVDMGIVLRFILTLRNLIKNARGVTE